MQSVLKDIPCVSFRQSAGLSLPLFCSLLSHRSDLCFPSELSKLEGDKGKQTNYRERQTLVSSQIPHSEASLTTTIKKSAEQ